MPNIDTKTMTPFEILKLEESYVGPPITKAEHDRRTALLIERLSRPVRSNKVGYFTIPLEIPSV